MKTEHYSREWLARLKVCEPGRFCFSAYNQPKARTMQAKTYSAPGIVGVSSSSSEELKLEISDKAASSSSLSSPSMSNAS